MCFSGKNNAERKEGYGPFTTIGNKTVVMDKSDEMISNTERTERSGEKTLKPSITK